MKTILILDLYDALASGRNVSRKEFCVEHGICERTFYRYLNDIYTFLRERRPDCVVDVLEPDGVYYLKKKTG